MSESNREIKAEQGSAQGFLHPSMTEGWQGSPLQRQASGNNTPEAHSKLFPPPPPQVQWVTVQTQLPCPSPPNHPHLPSHLQSEEQGSDQSPSEPHILSPAAASYSCLGKNRRVRPASQDISSRYLPSSHSLHLRDRGVSEYLVALGGFLYHRLNPSYYCKAQAATWPVSPLKTSAGFCCCSSNLGHSFHASCKKASQLQCGEMGLHAVKASCRGLRGDSPDPTGNSRKVGLMLANDIVSSVLFPSSSSR